MNRTLIDLLVVRTEQSLEYFVERVGLHAPFTEQEGLAGRHVQLHASDTGAVLTPIVLLLHQQVEFGHSPQRRIVFILIVLERFFQPHHRDAAFVGDFIAHRRPRGVGCGRGSQLQSGRSAPDEALGGILTSVKVLNHGRMLRSVNAFSGSPQEKRATGRRPLDRAGSVWDVRASDHVDSARLSRSLSFPSSKTALQPHRRECAGSPTLGSFRPCR